MTILIADDVWTMKLDELREPVEICAPDGRRLGLFTPAQTILPHEQPSISEAELQRRETDPEGKWYSAEAVVAKLRELQCSQ